MGWIQGRKGQKRVEKPLFNIQQDEILRSPKAQESKGDRPKLILWEAKDIGISFSGGSNLLKREYEVQRVL
jgi:hypothetical protein